MQFRNRAFILAGAAMLALSACGTESSGEFTTEDGEPGEYTIDAATGETSMIINGEDGEATLRAGPGVPISLPDGFTLFPGSKVINNAVVDQPDGKGTMITFEVDAPADKVVAHYRDAAKAAGFDIQLDMDTNGTRMVGGERKSDRATLSVTATAGQPSTGQLILATKKGG